MEIRTIIKTAHSSLWLVAILLMGLVISSCTNDDTDVEVVLPAPIIENIEIGSGNNGIGIIGRDFHFDMDVVAGELLGDIQVKIEGKSDQTYDHKWSFEITWDEYQGIKSTNVHKHFNIPADAPVGHYDFIVIVNDRNGTVLEDIREVELVDAADLPVEPLLYLWTIQTNEGDSHYVNELLENPEGVELSKDEILTSQIFIKNVKDDGKLYLLLIKKQANHFPETIGDIDFSKAIVYDVFEHENKEEVYEFSNVIFDGEGGQSRSAPELTIGAAVDNNTPSGNPISGEKSWESGTYYLGVVYTNKTHNLSMHHFMEFELVY
ncbi:DUF4625 domain-containing protein [Galbibacter sp.]|uniref:DUF4625 domain-containing protein n=1 Tax=Galbibacter sp. TaxID=2918471 RepID=UPI003A8CEECC